MKWFLLLMKRNFKKPSYLFILLLIPVVMTAMSLMTQRDGSVMTVGYLCEGEPARSTRAIFDSLEKDEGMLKFIPVDSMEKAMTMMEGAELDSLWVFPEDLESAVTKHYNENGSAVIKVMDRVSNQVTELAREKLFCLIYPYISRTIFDDYLTALPDGEDLTKEELDGYYGFKGIEGDIVNIVTVDSKGESSDEGTDYATSPLRGILAVIVMLSGLASAMFTLEDIRRGLFAIFSPSKRVWLYLLSILSALVPSSAVALISLSLGGMVENAGFELVRTALFTLSCAMLSLALMGVLKTSGRLSTAVPIITVASAVFSPVFLNIHSFPVIQMLFPTYHYLYAMTDIAFILYLVIYSVISGVIGIISCRKL